MDDFVLKKVNEKLGKGYVEKQNVGTASATSAKPTRRRNTTTPTRTKKQSTLSPSTSSVPHRSRVYFTRYNYDRPYMVVIEGGRGQRYQGSTVHVYRKTKTVTDTATKGPHASQYTIKEKTFKNVNDVWIGKSEECEFTTGVSSSTSSWWPNTSTSSSKNIQKEYDGNTILVNLGKGTYIQAGATIETIPFKEPVESYWSPVSNKGDVPQPLIVGKRVVCFADVEDVQEVDKKWFPKEMVWCDAPLYYLGVRDGLPMEKRKYS